MSNPKPKKAPARKRRSRSARKKKSGASLKRLIVFLSLAGLLIFTVGAVGYVIFFRTVLACEMEVDNSTSARQVAGEILAKRHIHTVS